MEENSVGGVMDTDRVSGGNTPRASFTITSPNTQARSQSGTKSSSGKRKRKPALAKSTKTGLTVGLRLIADGLTRGGGSDKSAVLGRLLRLLNVSKRQAVGRPSSKKKKVGGKKKPKSKPKSKPRKGVGGKKKKKKKKKAGPKTKKMRTLTRKNLGANRTVDINLKRLLGHVY
jgi:hypothetical protein